MIRTANDWDEILKSEFEAPYFEELRAFLRSEYRAGKTVYPPKDEILNALKLTSYKDTKILILGQDPYHGEGQAMGLCFSVREGVKIPPSLQNIFKELQNDIKPDAPDGVNSPEHKRLLSGDLSAWAAQGVLLLNTVLTVRASEPLSHRGKGWERFTDAVIKALAAREDPTVFILWGREAQAKESLIRGPEMSRPNKLILKGSHPSPLSAHHGFFGGRYFSKANRFLELTGREAIDWYAL